jgi:hypothetical protein
MKFPLETSAIFKSLLQKVAKEGNNKFKIKEYTFFFRYSTVRIGTVLKEEFQLPELDTNISEDDVLSLVFDVTGLDDLYITQMEVTRDALYIIPTRSKDKIESFENSVIAH